VREHERTGLKCLLTSKFQIVLGIGRLALNHFTRGFYDERLRIKDVTHEAVQVWH
jgi:hypothetical protein